MKRAENQTVLSPDRPLSDVGQDRLGYAPWAKHLADSISKMAPAEGFVIAICGPWGSGKSTILNFVEHHLAHLPKADRPVIVRFNPWWFSGSEGLLRNYLVELLTCFKKTGAWADKVCDFLSQFGEAATAVPHPIAGLFGKLLKALKSPRNSVAELKDHLIECFQKEKKKVVVVVDDVDRLASDEIRELFRVIKAVADFPHFIYLLAFDRRVVLGALDQLQNLPGREYLEKIVQATYEVPVVEKHRIRKMLSPELDALLAETPKELFDRDHWNKIYWEGLDHLVRTPRDVARLINTLRLTYPLVRDEVSFPDFFALEAFRTQRHIVYDTIRDSPNIFLGPEPFLAPPLNQDYLNKFHEGWLAKIEDAERRWIRAVVTAMFPRSGLTGWPAEEREKPEWHRTRRICCRSVFPTYFRCALPEDEIPSATVRQIVSGQLDESAIQQILVKFTNEKTHDEKLKIGYLLKQIGDYFPENISRVAVSPIVNALFEQGDVILRNTEEEQRDFLDFPTDRAVLGSIRPLLSLLPKNDRTDLLRSVVARSPALTTLVLVLTSFGEDHGKYGSQKTRPEETLVDEDALADLEKTALERIQQSADQDSLLNVPDLRFALYRWGDWGGRNKRTEWIQNVARDPSRLPRLLEAFVGVTREYGAQATMRYTLFEKLARELLPPDIAPTLRTIDRSSLSDRQQFAVNQMIALYDSQSNTEKE